MSTSNVIKVKPWKIYTSVSLSGACVMIFELAGARMIDPTLEHLSMYGPM